MSTGHEKYIELVNKLLLEMYVYLRKNGEIPDSMKSYVNGFLDAGLQLGIVSNTELREAIEEMNIKVFDKGLDERRKMYEDLKSTYEEYIDVPAFFREGKYTL